MTSDNEAVYFHYAGLTNIKPPTARANFGASVMLHVNAESRAKLHDILNRQYEDENGDTKYCYPGVGYSDVIDWAVTILTARANDVEEFAKQRRREKTPEFKVGLAVCVKAHPITTHRITRINDDGTVELKGSNGFSWADEKKMFDDSLTWPTTTVSASDISCCWLTHEEANDSFDGGGRCPVCKKNV